MAQFLFVLERAWTWAIVLVTLAGFIGLPLWLAYLFFAPFFGSDPLGHLISILKSVGFWVLFAGVGTVLLVGGMRAYERWRPVRLVMRAVGYIFVALVVLASLSRCLEGQGECVPSRYIDC